MTWRIEFCDDLDAEFPLLPEAVRGELLATLKFVQIDGPLTGRPAVDTLKGSAYASVKGLPFRCGKRRLARRVRLRSAAEDHPLGCRRQGGQEGERL
jgi:hypothetical protein